MKVAETEGAVLFEEKQHFPKWLTFLMLGQMVVVVCVLLIALRTTANQNELWPTLLFIIPFELLMIYFFRRTTLEKTVTREGFYYRWLPLQQKYRLIQSADIESMEARKSPSFKYGYGYFPGYGRYHNMSKGKGIQFNLSNGKRVFFGTSDLLSFERSLHEFLSSKTFKR